MKAVCGIRSLGWAALLWSAVVGRLCAVEVQHLRYAAGNSGTVKISSSPALDDQGYLYVGVAGQTSTSTIGRVVAIDPTSKAPRPGWTAAGFSTPDGVTSSPTIGVGSDKTIYFGCLDGFVYAVSTETGRLKWRQAVRVGAFVNSSPTLSPDGSVLYIGSGGSSGDSTSGDNGVHALRTSDGSTVWTFKTSDEVESSPALAADGTLYFGSLDRRMYAVKSSDGSLKWTQITGDGIRSSPAIGADGTVYVGSYDSYLYAFAPETGAIRWQHLVDGYIHASPALGPDGTIYFGSLSRRFFALNPLDGSERWAIGVGGPVFSSATVRSDGVVIFGADDGRLRWVFADTGFTKSAELISSDYIESSPTIARDGSVYVGSNDGNLYGYVGSSVTSLYSRWPMFRHDPARTGREVVPPEGGRLINLSTRGQAGEGKTLIAGLATAGVGEKNYLIRVAGPALAGAPFRVPNSLVDPAFSVMSQGSSTPLFSNNDWGLESNVAQIRQAFTAVGAFPFAEGSRDAAVLRPLRGGLYTAVVRGTPGSSGVALVEAYDADVSDSSTRLINLSTLATVAGGDDVLIAGLVIGGSAPVRVLVRGIGPALANFGVVGPLAKPKLTVFFSNPANAADASSELFSNAGWSTSVNKGDTAGMSRVVGAFPLLEGSADCAALASLSPGAYTIQISGLDNTTGVALVEVYLLP